MEKTLNVIEYHRSEIFKHACCCYYDIYITDRCEVDDYFDGVEPIVAMRDSEEFVKALKDGYSAIMLPDFMLIEQMVTQRKNFIVVVYDGVGQNKTVWATVNGADIMF